MITSYSRKAGIAAIACVVGLATAIAITPNGMKVWYNTPFVLILGAVGVASFFLTFWWVLKAKRRSDLWMLMLLLNLIGMVVILLLRDQSKGAEESASGATPPQA